MPRTTHRAAHRLAASIEFRSAFHAFEERWCAAVLERLGPTTQNTLDELLVTGPADDGTGEPAESRRSVLNELKADAGAISLDSMISEITKLAGA
jgi:hypothetical protein